MKKIILLSLITFGLLTDSGAQDWYTFNSSDGKFRIMFPSEPTTQIDSSKTYPAYRTNMLIAKGKTDIFLVGWVDYESKYTFTEQIELEANRDNFLEGIKGTLVESKNIEFNGYKGLEFSARSGSYFWTSKVFIVGRRPYQLIAGSNTGKPSDNENKFYDSFSVRPN